LVTISAILVYLAAHQRLRHLVAAEFGNANSMTQLGELYAEGGGGLAKDQVRAMARFRKTAAAGDAEGMDRTSHVVSQGGGCC
jgi:TPR repeat protein